ncbi:MAG: putative isomaltodextranase [Daejeonella sp.]|nr:putative isomaltodextranase [Daejeonella sp.]
MKKLIFAGLACALCLFSCKKESKETRTSESGNQVKLSGKTAAIPSNPFKAPLYWNPYEYNITTDNYIPESEWSANINWMETNLKPYGYKMICIDGWGDDGKYNTNGYRTTHSSNWTKTYAEWSTILQGKGMTLGIYNNPLWIIKSAADAGVKIKGTNIPLSSIMNEGENATWFKWVQVDKPGAMEYVKGYVDYYGAMGVKYLRVDFLSWYESGQDRNMGRVGATHTLAQYQKALRWIREACDARGMMFSVVMPNLFNEAATELQYGHMIRINDDAGTAQWDRFNNIARGQKRVGWSVYSNAFDGYTYWSKLTGKNKMILDGDFIRLNTFANDEEKKTVISAHLMAGGPVSVSDRYNSIGNDLWLYQNTEMLDLNVNWFVGKPLTNDPTNPQSQVWKGQLPNGDWVVGLFNREDTWQTRSINFVNDLAITGNATVRDMWKHQDLGTTAQSFSQVLAPHACLILKIVKTTGGIFNGATYEIVARNSGKAFDISANSLLNGALLNQWTYGSAANQKFKIESNGDGYYRIMAMHSGKVLDIVGGSLNDDVSAHQWDLTPGVNSQEWSFVDVGAGYYKIVNRNSGKVLDVYGASTADGAAIKQFTYTGSPNQQFSLIKL